MEDFLILFVSCFWIFSIAAWPFEELAMMGRFMTLPLAILTNYKALTETPMNVMNLAISLILCFMIKENFDKFASNEDLNVRKSRMFYISYLIRCKKCPEKIKKERYYIRYNGNIFTFGFLGQFLYSLEFIPGRIGNEKEKMKKKISDYRKKLSM